MRYRSLLSLVLLIVTHAAVAAPLLGPKNLLINGSFEQGPAIGNYLNLPVGNTSLKGWTVIRGAVDYVGNYWQTAQGGHSIDLHGSPGRGGLQQSFKTTPGKYYTVTFYLAGNPEGNVHPTKSIEVSAAGSSQKFTFDVKGKTLKKMGWVRKTWRFMAVGKETTLEIYSTTMDNEIYGPTIDAVKVLAE